jgi:hypothetical protein
VRDVEGRTVIENQQRVRHVADGRMPQSVASRRSHLKDPKDLVHPGTHLKDPKDL